MVLCQWCWCYALEPVFMMETNTIKFCIELIVTYRCSKGDVVLIHIAQMTVQNNHQIDLECSMVHCQWCWCYASEPVFMMETNTIKFCIELIVTYRCSKGDVVLLCLDEKYDHYVVFTVGVTLHFLHSDCLDSLSLRPGKSLGHPLPTYPPHWTVSISGPDSVDVSNVFII